MKFSRLILCLSILFGSFAMAKENKGISKKNEKSKLSTDVRFGNKNVLGKYAHSSEAAITVQKEKKLIEVVEPRRSLKKQLKKSQEWYQ